MPTRLQPKLFTVLKEGYSLSHFSADLVAGLITGIVALPLAIAFGIASGVKPEQGLYTAIIAGFLISLLSGSRVQIGGPTGAFIVIVYGVVQQHGIQGLTLATMMAGGLLVILGIARLGSVIKYMPYPVTVGFTTGIAVIIAVTQVPDFFGLRLATTPGEFLEKIELYWASRETLNPWALGVGASSLGIILIFPKVTHRIPGSLIAILLVTPVVALFNLPVETIGSRFGEVPNSLPKPTLPDFDLANLQSLFPAAVTIASLGAIESLLSAVVADGMIGTRHRSNMELVAQGVANIVTPFFGGIPATGAIARTATNIKNGGRTPIAGMIHAVTLLLILLFFGKWASLIPMPVLAAVLLIVAYNMSEWRLFMNLFSSPRSDLAVLLITFFLTVLVDLTVAIEAGIVLAAFLFMRRMEKVTHAGFIIPANDEEEEIHDPFSIARFDIPEGVEVFEINGPFFFGAASKFQDAMTVLEKPPKVLILRMRHVPAIDATGLHALESIFKKTESWGTELLISGIRPQPSEALAKSGLKERMGSDRIHKNVGEALRHARALIEEKENRVQ
ncbi:MAG: sulfate permease [Candidatus Omnitrophica bacterium]|nr:sulfate permease [Candidatus Omnitrophota bacterium]